MQTLMETKEDFEEPDAAGAIFDVFKGMEVVRTVVMKVKIDRVEVVLSFRKRKRFRSLTSTVSSTSAKKRSRRKLS